MNLIVAAGCSVVYLDSSALLKRVIIEPLAAAMSVGPSRW